MSKKSPSSSKRGRGRESTSPVGATAATSAKSDTCPFSPDDTIQWIPVKLLDAHPSNPESRYADDDPVVQGAAADFAAGKKMPAEIAILVRPIADGRFQVVGGHRRWRGAVVAGLTKVPSWVREMTDREALIALVKNNEHDPLSPLELGRNILDMLAEAKARGKKLTLERYAEIHHKKVDTVKWWHRAAVVAAGIEPFRVKGSAEPFDLNTISRNLSVIRSAPKSEWQSLVECVAGSDLSVRRTEALVKRVNQEREDAADAKPKGDGAVATGSSTQPEDGKGEGDEPEGGGGDEGGEGEVVRDPGQPEGDAGKSRGRPKPPGPDAPPEKLLDWHLPQWFDPKFGLRAAFSAIPAELRPRIYAAMEADVLALPPPTPPAGLIEPPKPEVEEQATGDHREPEVEDAAGHAAEQDRIDRLTERAHGGGWTPNWVVNPLIELILDYGPQPAGGFTYMVDRIPNVTRAKLVCAPDWPRRKPRRGDPKGTPEDVVNVYLKQLEYIGILRQTEDGKWAIGERFKPNEFFDLFKSLPGAPVGMLRVCDKPTRDRLNEESHAMFKAAAEAAERERQEAERERVDHRVPRPFADQPKASRTHEALELLIKGVPAFDIVKKHRYSWSTVQNAQKIKNDANDTEMGLFRFSNYPAATIIKKIDERLKTETLEKSDA